MPKTLSLPTLSLLVLGLIPTPSEAILISIDYTYDTFGTSGFFSPGSAERARLEDAASYFGDLLVDDLDAIEPPGHWQQFDGEAWQAVFENPSGTGTIAVSDLVVASDEIIIYAGSEALGGSNLAQAGFGGANLFTINGSDFDNAIKTRGETGVGTTDVAPWGGHLTINNGTSWDTDLAGTGSGQHLYSTLLHEIAHVLGIGTALSWTSQVTGGSFMGTESMLENGGAVALNTGEDHWLEGTTSDIRGTTTSQETAFDPDIVSGTTKLLTNLDVAGLDDIGWDIAPVPEPSQTLLLALSCGLLLTRRR